MFEDCRALSTALSKAQSKGRLNNKTKVSEVRDVRLNERALHALEAVRPYTGAAGGCIFRSARYTADFKTEKSQRIIFKRILIELGIRHRKAYNARHTYATMLLMAGANIAFVAGQLGHSIIMTTTIYGKWINGEADRAEMAKLKTENKNAPAEIREPNNFLKSEKEKIGDISATSKRQSAQVIEFKRKNWSGRQDLNLSDE